eukprot:gene8471-biopygen6126
MIHRIWQVRSGAVPTPPAPPCCSSAFDRRLRTATPTVIVVLGIETVISAARSSQHPCWTVHIQAQPGRSSPPPPPRPSSPRSRTKQPRGGGNPRGVRGVRRRVVRGVPPCGGGRRRRRAVPGGELPHGGLGSAVKVAKHQN